MKKLSNAQQTVLDAAANRPDGSIYPLPPTLKGGAAKKVVTSLKSKGLIDDEGRLLASVEQHDQTPPSTDEVAETNDITETEEANAEISSEAESETEEAHADPEPEAEPEAEEVNADTESETTETTSEADPKTSSETETTPSWNQPDKDFMAIAQKHLADLIPDKWDAIRDTIEEAFVLGYEEAKAEFQTKKVRTTRSNSKQAMVIDLMKRPEGASIDQIIETTGWKNPTVRGFLSLAKTRLGLEITSQRRHKDEDGLIIPTTYHAA